jgi:hypothetical protein
MQVESTRFAIDGADEQGWVFACDRLDHRSGSCRRSPLGLSSPQATSIASEAPSAIRRVAPNACGLTKASSSDRGSSMPAAYTDRNDAGAWSTVVTCETVSVATSAGALLLMPNARRPPARHEIPNASATKTSRSSAMRIVAWSRACPPPHGVGKKDFTASTCRYWDYPAMTSWQRPRATRETSRSPRRSRFASRSPCCLKQS